MIDSEIFCFRVLLATMEETKERSVAHWPNPEIYTVSALFFFVILALIYSVSTLSKTRDFIIYLGLEEEDTVGEVRSS